MAADTSVISRVESKELKLSAPGQYAFAGLAAHILAELYSDDVERDFRHRLMEVVRQCIDLSESAMLPHIAVADGEYDTKPEPLIDLLLEEKVIEENPLSLLSSFLMNTIADGKYDARVRVILEQICWLLRVDLKSVEDIEEQILEILKSAEELSPEEKEKAAKKARNKKIGRGIAIGVATVIGGTVVGVTGGLAAPLIASGLGVIIGTAGGAALATTAGVAVIGSLFGAAGAGLAGYKMKKRVGGVEQFEFELLTPGSQMSLTVAISGWVTSKGEEDFRKPWLTLDNSKEQYYLKYEGKYLQELGKSLDRLSKMAVTQAVTETLKYTALNTLLAAIAWPSAMLSLASVIDNPWHVCTKRAENTGKQLAEVLANREQGHRPVTLIGFSLGARVIFHCLRALAEHPRGAGIIENAYLLGAPVSGNVADWKPFSKVVAGKIVNAYIRNDWILKFLYRTASAQLTIAGTKPVEWDDRRMVNMDLTNVVNGHMDYMKKMTVVLEAVGIHTKPLPTTFSSYSVRSDSPLPLPAPTEDRKPLLSKPVSSKDTQENPKDLIPTTNTEGEVSGATEQDQTTTSTLPYEKLERQEKNGIVQGPLSDIKQGETTESDKSLPEVMHYEELLEQGSSQSCMPKETAIKPKKKLIKVPNAKMVGSERLLGDIATKEKLLDEGSNDSILSVGHLSAMSLRGGVAVGVPETPLAMRQKPTSSGGSDKESLVTSISEDKT
ncbi:transmembrane and coiled-coil domain-containing protein 4-like [Watersipora subatra]|uniref:transmembrane and coiled-coil domain-containing protein 4-like n=1 Tax=Watersipora subatra TaxID=2589382 RepID=UPI00355C92A2